MSTKTVGETLTELLIDQISEERTTKSSLAQRSSVAIAAAGTIVPLSLGAITLASRSQTFAVPRLALALTAIAIALLVLAAILALIVNSPWTQTILDVDQLAGGVATSNWSQDSSDLVIASYAYRLRLAGDLHRGNRIRGRLLTAVLCLEILALVAVSGGVGLLLLTGGL